MAAKPKKLDLLLNTTSPIGEACVFKTGSTYTVYYKQSGFLPRAISTTSEDEVKNFLMSVRVISEANYNRIMDPTTPPVLVAETRPATPNSDDGTEDEYDTLDEFDEVIED